MHFQTHPNTEGQKEKYRVVQDMFIFFVYMLFIKWMIFNGF